MSVTGVATNPIFLMFILLFVKFQIPVPKSQANSQFAISQKSCAHDPLLFEMMAEKISSSSRASAANASRLTILFFVKPASTRRKNKRLSLASFRQILVRIRKSFLLKASSASIQLAATEPDARTNCRTSSVLLIVLGNCFTNVRTDSANKNVRSSRSRGLAPFPIFGFGVLLFTWDLELGIWNLPPRHRLPLLELGFGCLFGTWFWGFGACRCNGFLCCVGQIVRRNQCETAFFEQLFPFFNVRSFQP